MTVGVDLRKNAQCRVHVIQGISREKIVGLALIANGVTGLFFSETTSTGGVVGMAIGLILLVAGVWVMVWRME